MFSKLTRLPLARAPISSLSSSSPRRTFVHGLVSACASRSLRLTRASSSLSSSASSSSSSSSTSRFSSSNSFLFTLFAAAAAAAAAGVSIAVLSSYVNLNGDHDDDVVAHCEKEEEKKKFKVAIVGAAGGIGQPLSLLMKQSPLVSELRLFDVAPTHGIAVDLSHINTASVVHGFTGADMAKALEGVDMVIVPAGVPRKPGMTRDDLFNVNAGIVSNIASTIAVSCPSAFVLVISNPVNSMVPIVAETLKKKSNKYDNRKLFGVTTLDVLRANTFVAENQKLPVSRVNVPVIGGHAGITILPLLSSVKDADFSHQDIEALTKRIMFGGDEVVAAKAGAGSATLSMAYAGYTFATSVLRAASGDRGIVECAYIDSPLSVASQEGLSFFASPVVLGPNGIESVPSLPVLDEFEEQKLKEAIPDLKAAIQKGVEYVNNKK